MFTPNQRASKLSEIQLTSPQIIYREKKGRTK